MVSEESMENKVKWVEVNLPSTITVVEEGAFCIWRVHSKLQQNSGDIFREFREHTGTYKYLKGNGRIYTYLYRR